MSPEERLRVMRDNSEKSEKITFYRSLTQEELDTRRELLTNNYIFISEEDDKLAEIKLEFKGLTEPKKKENAVLLEEVKLRKAKVTATVYHIMNVDDGTMETYDETGEFVSSRRLTPEEKAQQKLWPVRNMTGTED